MRHCHIVAAALVGICFFAGAAGAEPVEKYTFVWLPRSADVGNSDSKSFKTLAAILKLMPTTEYKVAAGENFDFVLRKSFLVSQSLHHAYQLYADRVRELNPGLNYDVLPTGTRLRIPLGPRYEGTELAKEPIPAGVFSSTFNRLSAQAYELGSPTADKVFEHSTQALTAFVSPFKKATPQAAFESIQARGLIGAIDVVKHPEWAIAQMQAYDLKASTPEQRSTIAALKSAAPQSVLPGMIPMSAPASVSCTGCTSCADTIKLPPGLDMSRARVLIEDTGITPGVIAPSNQLPQGSGGDGKDLDPVSHGTFVYSEIASAGAPGGTGAEHGFIPKAQVYVTRVVQPRTGGGLDFSMSDIVKGWQSFVSTISSDSAAATTAVVNLSEAGAPLTGMYEQPDIWYNNRLLIVAAAGNHNNRSDPTYAPFGVYSSGSIPLLIVGAVGVDGSSRASYSNYDESHVQLFARGDCVCGAPGQISGTSQATPVVAAAAAALASAHPRWLPIYVMWRLISTADQSAGIPVFGVFGGVVNLVQALNPAIVIKNGATFTQTTTHNATRVMFSSAWANAIDAKNLNADSMELLRLYAPKTQAGQTCFTAIQMSQLMHFTLCTNANDLVTYVENGKQAPPLAASELQDLILPVGIVRDTSQKWPTVAVAAH